MNTKQLSNNVYDRTYSDTGIFNSLNLNSIKTAKIWVMSYDGASCAPCIYDAPFKENV